MTLELEGWECAQRIPIAPTDFKIRDVNSDWFYHHSAKKLEVEPPVTVDLSFCLAALHDVSHVTVFSCGGAHRMKLWLV